MAICAIRMLKQKVWAFHVNLGLAMVRLDFFEKLRDSNPSSFETVF